MIKATQVLPASNCTNHSYIDYNGVTALHKAILDVDRKSILEIIDSADCNLLINYPDINGNTPLHYAISVGKSWILKELLSHEFIKVNLENNDHITPIAQIHTTIFDQSTRDKLLRYFKFEDLEYEYRHDNFHLAAYSGQNDWLKETLQAGIRINAKDYQGNTALHLASSQGHKDSVAILLKEKNIDVNTKNFFSLSPIEIAIEKGFLEIADLLVEYGADLQGLPNISKLFLSLCQKGEIASVEFLLSKGINANIIDSITQDSTLHIAIENNNYQLVKLLVNNNVDINSRNKIGTSPLLLAFEKSSIQIISLLLDVGANIEDKDNLGREVILYAACNKSPTPLKYLIEQLNFPINERMNQNGTTVLHYAAANSSNETLAYIDILTYIDINLPDKKNRIPFHYAAAFGDKEVIEFFINKGSNLYIKDETNNTPLHYLLKRNDVSLLEPLHKLKPYIDLYEKDQDGFSLIDYLTLFKNSKLINTLCTWNFPLQQDINSIITSIFIDPKNFENNINTTSADINSYNNFGLSLGYFTKDDSYMDYILKTNPKYSKFPILNVNNKEAKNFAIIIKGYDWNGALQTPLINTILQEKYIIGIIDHNLYKLDLNEIDKAISYLIDKAGLIPNLIVIDAHGVEKNDIHYLELNKGDSLIPTLNLIEIILKATNYSIGDYLITSCNSAILIKDLPFILPKGSSVYISSEYIGTDQIEKIGIYLDFYAFVPALTKLEKLSISSYNLLEKLWIISFIYSEIYSDNINQSIPTYFTTGITLSEQNNDFTPKMSKLEQLANTLEEYQKLPTNKQENIKNATLKQFSHFYKLLGKELKSEMIEITDYIHTNNIDVRQIRSEESLSNSEIHLLAGFLEIMDDYIFDIF
jgi:ankyrin repeat protein